MRPHGRLLGAVMLFSIGCLPAPGTPRTAAASGPHPYGETNEPASATATLGTWAPLPTAPWRIGRPSSKDHPNSRADAPTILLQNARILLGNGGELARGHVLLEKGRIASIGEGPGDPPKGAEVIDANGKTITPGFVDTHSHMGVYPMPSAHAHEDGNELSAPLSAGARTVDAIWPFDPAFERAVAGGTTTVQVLPGSANLIGGRATTIKLHPASTGAELVFPGAPYGLKMACGENPKRVHGREKKGAPATRMGNLTLQRGAFLKARRHIEQWDAWRATESERRASFDRKVADLAKKQGGLADARAACGNHPSERCLARAEDKHPTPVLEPFEPRLPPERDLDSETLAGALEGSLLVHVHCYRSDDMGSMLALSDEVGFKVASFHHALEAYKIRDELTRRGIAVSTWADWFGFKLEAYDGIPENLALVHAAGGSAVVHTDSSEGVRRLNQEASKGMWSGRNAGIQITEAEAIRWVTENPAKALGVDRWVGTLEVGKDADVVVWGGNPFSVYGRAELVFVDGILRHDLKNPPKRSWSDFEVKP